MDAGASQSAADVAQQGLLGVVDVGSNSIRLVIFEDDARSPDYVFNEKVICKLGQGLGETGRLNPEGREKAMSALRRFTGLARLMGAREVISVGTAALREAEDGPAFRAEVLAETGLDIRVATGREEAHLAAHGVLLGWPTARGVIADLGGSSLELARVVDGEIKAAVSTPAGHLRLGNRESDSARAALRALDAAAAGFDAEAGDLILVGGAWRALAKAEIQRTDYPLNVLQGFQMSAEATRDLCDWALGADAAELKRLARASSARSDSIANGAYALRRLVEATRPAHVVISAFGVREGLVYERMSPALRKTDPLIAAARWMEGRSARFPGFGDELSRWLAPLVEAVAPDRARLARAACLLHDVNWRAHPDFRAAACFATIARANLSGVSHQSRIYVGAILLHRYKGASVDADAKKAVALLEDEDRRSAEIIGRAIRLGAMITASVPGVLAETALAIDDESLTLTLPDTLEEYFGVSVERRLKALANATGRAPHVVIGGSERTPTI